MLKPKTKERHVGIEIECISRTSPFALRRSFRKAKVAQYTEIAYDGSIEVDDADEDAFEIRICVPQSRASSVIKKVCAVLKEHKAYVNETCGMHVHLDVRNDNPRAVWGNLYAVQDVLFSMVDDTRLENLYCETLEGGSRYEDACDHYTAISNSSVSKHQTIETRMHHGTVDGREISSFVELLVAVAYAPSKRDRVASVVKEFSLSASLGRVIKQAMKKQGRTQVVTI